MLLLFIWSERNVVLLFLDLPIQFLIYCRTRHFLIFYSKQEKNLVIRYFRINNGLKSFWNVHIFFPDQTHSMLLDFMMHFL